MKKKNLYIYTVLFFLLAVVGCSVKKNTPTRRAYHAVTTKYNVYFNANEMFKRGYKRLEEEYSPNYSQVIDVYLNGGTGSASSDMAGVNTKCQKALKEHSIRKKPKKKSGKSRDPKYMAFYNKEEFNSMIDDVWMLMAKAKYYSGDYLAASSLFTYVSKHFPEYPALCAEALVWKARSFKELDWLYEAEEILSNVSDEHFTPKVNCLYNGAYADLKIKQGELREALPYLITAIPLEKDKKQKRRFQFAAGQIYQELGIKDSAFMMYDEVISSSPSYEMAFNAKIRQTEVYGGKNREKMVKSLLKMVKNVKNEDYQDQIYYAIGNIYLADGDTASAIKNYKLSAEKSTRHGKEKAQSLITLGRLYYENNAYMEAQPCFSEAASIIDHTHPEYEEVSRLALILDELAKDYETVVLQDSLQRLALMTKEERLTVIRGVIKKIEDEERAERERIEKERLMNRQLDLQIDNVAVMDRRALGGNQRADWYFFNKSVVDKGKLEFQRKFGVRKLEDNWNRKNKMVVFTDENLYADEEDGDGAAADSTAAGNMAQTRAESDPKSVEFYLRQIPFTEEQKAASDAMIADALFNQGMVYYEKLQDYEKAEDAFVEFARRFPADKRLADAYFSCYQMLKKQNDNASADVYKDKLVSQCPDSKYAKILSQPDYRAKLERMQAVQDSLYEQTYRDFLSGEYSKVVSSSVYMEQEYPVSPLMPKFLLLKSLSIGKTGDKDSLSKSLDDLLVRYPDSDVASMAKDIIALMNQGQNPTAGSAGGLMSLRDSQVVVLEGYEAVEDRNFKVDNEAPCVFCIVTDPAQVKENLLLYEVAMYNFTKFLVKDFDLAVKNGVLYVSELDNMEEALWYAGGIMSDAGVKKLLDGKDYKYFAITKDNLELIGRGFSVDDYIAFYNQNVVNAKKKKDEFKVQLVGDEKAVEEITKTEGVSVSEGDNLVDAVVQPSAVAGADSADTVAVQLDSQNAVVATDTVRADIPQKKVEKYKGLYTYEENAKHVALVLINSKTFDYGKLKMSVEKYNSQQHPLMNLSVEKTDVKGMPGAVMIKGLPSADVAASYSRQLGKAQFLKSVLGRVSFRVIAVSEDNLKVLNETGNINVYMELYKKKYQSR